MSVRILTGDCRQVLRTLAEDSVHCCITSPPYWGLRDYGIPPTVWGGDAACEHVWGDDVTKIGGGKQPADKVRWQHDTDARPNGHQAAAAGAFCHCGAWRGAHGLEPTIDLYVRNAVEVFRAVRRVLRPDGTLWLNLGDSYGGYHGNSKRSDNEAPSNKPGYIENMRASTVGANSLNGLKPKDLCGIPWRVAFALQADGWWLRQDIIWAKPNPMPESVTDRCTKAHEYLFMLSKSARYYYDQEAIREPINPNNTGQCSVVERRGGTAFDDDGKPIGAIRSYDVIKGRNKRSVWTVATAPWKEAHFATFPPELIEPCIRAGSSEKGCCAKCGAPWERIVERGEIPMTERRKDLAATQRQGHPDYIEVVRPSSLGAGSGGDVPGRSVQTTGWRPTCKCDAATVPCTVLDPFGGAGTTGLVADRLQRNAILIELNPDYASMAHRRLSADAPLLAHASTKAQQEAAV